MYRILALVLIFAFVLQAANVRNKLLTTPTGSPVILYFKDGTEVQGKVLNTDTQGVRIQLNKNGEVEEKFYDYKQIRAVHTQEARMSPGRTILITLGVLWIVGALVSLVIGTNS